MTDFLPCPFCGHEVIDSHGWVSDKPAHGPACDNCSASASSAEEWNQRPREDALRTQMQEMFANMDNPTGRQIDKILKRYADCLFTWTITDDDLSSDLRKLSHFVLGARLWHCHKNHRLDLDALSKSTLSRFSYDMAVISFRFKNGDLEPDMKFLHTMEEWNGR